MDTATFRDNGTSTVSNNSEKKTNIVYVYIAEVIRQIQWNADNWGIWVYYFYDFSVDFEIISK